MNNQVNVIIDIISAIMVFVVFFSNLRQSRKQKNRKLLNALMICVASVLLLDIPAWLLDGADFYGSGMLCLILDTAYYLAQIIYCRMWLMYVDNWLTESKKRKISTRLLFSIPMFVEIVVIFANIKTGWIFTISPDNVYERGSFYSVNLTLYFFYILAAVFYACYAVFKSRKTEKHRRNSSILLYMFLPVCGAIIQSLSYGLTFLWPFVAVSLLMVFLNLQSQMLTDERITTATETAKITQLENELADSRVRIMLSQIQPHFLYNCLSVIHALCDTEPNVAAKAIEDFSVYLRCNMDSLNTDKLIPFAKELEHTKRYLSLEKLRFQDNLQIEYDINAADFMLPALSLQPIVENAVRYGITKQENGGSLIISTRLTNLGYEITVSDNGVGFNPQNEKSDSASGIANVEKRLETMCGGSLKVKSAIGNGTVVTISVPNSCKENT